MLPRKQTTETFRGYGSSRIGDAAAWQSRTPGYAIARPGIAMRARPAQTADMHLSRADLADLYYFLAIARHRNFRLAGLELGVTASALSHGLKGLESRLGVRLFDRDRRSVALTAAGEELQKDITSPFEDIGEAVARLNRFRDAPTGRIRLSASSDAALLLLTPVLPIFIERHPRLMLDLSVDDHPIDPDEGFDASIRLGGTVPPDMVAERLSRDLPLRVAGAPAYFERFGEPGHPSDLQHHRCLLLRGPDAARWEFHRDSERLTIVAPGSLTLDDTRSMTSLMLAGSGLIYAPEPLVRHLVDEGRARYVLEDWSSSARGFHMLHPGRRPLPIGLTLLVDLIRETCPLGT